MPVRLIGCDYRKSAMEDEIMRSGQRYQSIEPHVHEPSSVLLKSCSFALEYLIAALLSRGAVVKDQILVCHHVLFSGHLHLILRAVCCKMFANLNTF
ncbi:unnamed protein product [Gongylonema pulchrum]|uniref:Uncharacterized protein n=1 Tax=Gongylonema pulchrum TaxID=637853 RepID=A0A183DIP1_9BILA|nr:unnamed protein product [Gongylonema pulchrum]